MSLEFQFETFVDVYHSIFSEYLSSVVAKLPKENEKYLRILCTERQACSGGKKGKLI